jgi:hypothetical protein
MTLAGASRRGHTTAMRIMSARMILDCRPTAAWRAMCLGYALRRKFAIARGFWDLDVLRDCFAMISGMDAILFMEALIAVVFVCRTRVANNMPDNLGNLRISVCPLVDSNSEDKASIYENH